MSTLKYLYQIFLNHDRQSTEGFSNWNVFLDFTGGSCSLVQEILRFVDGVAIDATAISKFFLSCVGIFFDVILVVQLRLYRHNKTLKKKVEESLEKLNGAENGTV